MAHQETPYPGLQSPVMSWFQLCGLYCIVLYCILLYFIGHTAQHAGSSCMSWFMSTLVSISAFFHLLCSSYVVFILFYFLLFYWLHHTACGIFPQELVHVYVAKHICFFSTAMFQLCGFDFLLFYLFNYLFIYLFLAMLHGMPDLSSPTRDRTCVPCIGSAESYQLDHQGSPQDFIQRGI